LRRGSADRVDERALPDRWDVQRLAAFVAELREIVAALEGTTP
jgi:hypothetical protein